MTAYRCAAASRRRHEPVLATASRVDRWLLVEQSGPWGPQAPPHSRLREPLLNTLRRQAAEVGARLLLIRRPSRVARAEARHVFLADSRPGRERALLRVATDDELPELGLPGERTTTRFWAHVQAPLLLVCTHGRHDPCCAIRGRPVAAAIAADFPDTTWECSHVGGDRFAANLLVLPAGLYFGRVQPHDAVAVAQQVMAGHLPTEHFRGRSSFSGPSQAAQHFARAELGMGGVDDLPPVRQERVDRERWEVVLRAHPRDVVVTVRRSLHNDGEPLTCHADQPTAHPVYDLVDLTVGP